MRSARKSWKRLNLRPRCRRNELGFLNPVEEMATKSTRNAKKYRAMPDGHPSCVALEVDASRVGLRQVFGGFFCDFCDFLWQKNSRAWRPTPALLLAISLLAGTASAQRIE